MGPNSEHTAHIPVLLSEIMPLMPPAGLVVDATFGAGGYSRAVLSNTTCRVLALDQDPHVAPYAQKLLRDHRGRFSFVQANFKNLAELLDEAPAAIVFDLGISSMQIDDAERGFSFMRDGPLDMRMSGEGLAAADVVNGFTAERISDIISAYGEEKRARRIAKAIEKRRASSPIAGTLELADVVSQAAGSWRGGPNYPVLARVFQALRMFVGDELESLRLGLKAGAEKLAPSGVLAAVSFHSLEDRVVKEFFATLTKRDAGKGASRYRPDVGAGEGAISAPEFLRAPRAFIVPSAEEVRANPRAASAKLRYVIKKAKGGNE